MRSEIEARKEADQSYSDVGKQELERHFALYRLILPSFSEAEAYVLINAFNGRPRRLDVAYACDILSSRVAEELEDERLDVDRQALLSRVRGLHLAQCMAVIDAIERYWIGPYHKSPEESAKRLREVGLVK